MPLIVTWPIPCRLLISMITISCLPTSDSALVLSLSRLKYFIAIGLVKNSNTAETTAAMMICSQTGPPRAATRIATRAPPANQIVVSPSVKISITTSMIRIASHTITGFVTHSILFSPFCQSDARHQLSAPIHLLFYIFFIKYTTKNSKSSREDFLPLLAARGACSKAVAFLTRPCVLKKDIPENVPGYPNSFFLNKIHDLRSQGPL